jgi:hypothetical protein
MKKATARYITTLPGDMTQDDLPRSVDGEVYIASKEKGHAGEGWAVIPTEHCHVCHGRGLVDVSVPGKDPVRAACNCCWEAIVTTRDVGPATSTSSTFNITDLTAAVLAAEAELSRMALVLADEKARLRVENRGLKQRFHIQLAHTEQLQGMLVAAQEAEAAMGDIDAGA